MRSRWIAVLLAGALALAACSSGSGTKNTDESVDSEFKSLVDGATDSTAVPAEKINIPCLSAELTKRQREGAYTQGDLNLWVAGLGADGPVQEAANEILASGNCLK